MRLLLSLLLVASALRAADEPTPIVLNGRVVLTDPPKTEVEKVVADRNFCCRKGELESTKVLHDKPTGGFKNVIVWLRPDSDDRNENLPKEMYAKSIAARKPVVHTFELASCQFEPRVIAAFEGDRLRILNSSPITMNVNNRGSDQPLNVALNPNTRVEVDDALVADMYATTYKSDIHPWMQGRLRTFDHPFFAITDREGKFEIPGVPPGKYRIVYWHETGYHKGKEGLLGFPIVVADDGKGKMKAKTIDFQMPGRPAKREYVEAPEVVETIPRPNVVEAIPTPIVAEMIATPIVVQPIMLQGPCWCGTPPILPPPHPVPSGVCIHVIPAPVCHRGLLRRIVCAPALRGR